MSGHRKGAVLCRRSRQTSAVGDGQRVAINNKQPLATSRQPAVEAPTGLSWQFSLRTILSVEKEKKDRKSRSGPPVPGQSQPPYSG